MNKLGKVFIALFITTSFASCTSDDNPVNDTLGTIAGNWNINTAEHDASTEKSRLGYIVLYAGCPIIWSSKLQTQVALSTTEAEYVSLS